MTYDKPQLAVGCCSPVKTVTGWTILFLVLLRMSIGWHFLYEGAWKLNQTHGWRATGYLMASNGPFRDFFVGMVDDPHGLRRLDPDDVKRRMDRRRDQAILHYNLSDRQEELYRAFVERKKNGIQDDINVDALFADPAMEAKIEAIRGGTSTDPNGDLQILMGEIRAIFEDLDRAVASIATEEQAKKAMQNPLPPPAIVPGGADPLKDLSWLTKEHLNGQIDARYKRLRESYDLTEEQHQSSYGERYAVQKKIGGKRDINFVDTWWNNPDYQKALSLYKEFVEEIDRVEHEEGAEYKDERLAYDYKKKYAALENLLSGQEPGMPVGIEIPLNDIDPKKMDTFGEQVFFGDARLRPEQLMHGPLPAEPSQTRSVDWANMLGLTLIGACLMLGLFTRFAAVCGAVMLGMFYLSMPPWPGLPEAPNSEGHYLFINKNVIEMIALLVIATSGVGRWFGLDAFLGAAAMRRRARELDEAQATAAAPATA